MSDELILGNVKTVLDTTSKDSKIRLATLQARPQPPKPEKVDPAPVTLPQESALPEPPEPTEAQIRILKVMGSAKGRIDLKELAKRAGLNSNQAIDQMEQLTKTGFLQKIGKGYALTDKAKAEIAEPEIPAPPSVNQENSKKKGLGFHMPKMFQD